MKELTKQRMEQYLESVFHQPAEVLALCPLGETVQKDSIKTYGYGQPVRVDYRLDGGEPRQAVFHTSRPNSFGHEHMADRARDLLWAHEAFNRLPRHSQSLDVGAVHQDGSLRSLEGPQELCQLTEYVPGESYHRDLERIRDSGEVRDLDLERADALCDYLAGIHRRAGGDAGLYARRLRELLGHGECIFGLTDSYPAHPLIPASMLEQIEHACVRWRWKLKPLRHRMRQVHGDFHPWNILLAEGAELRVLDRSRGEWGDPADDVTSITANYLFFGLQATGSLDGAFAELFERFWRRYLKKSGDEEMLRVVAPYYAFRGLVMASPVWYPKLSDAVRLKLLSFIQNVLREDEFDPREVNRYCAG